MVKYVSGAEYPRIDDFEARYNSDENQVLDSLTRIEQKAKEYGVDIDSVYNKIGFDPISFLLNNKNDAWLRETENYVSVVIERTGRKKNFIKDENAVLGFFETAETRHEIGRKGFLAKTINWIEKHPYLSAGALLAAYAGAIGVNQYQNNDKFADYVDKNVEKAKSEIMLFKNLYGKRNSQPFKKHAQNYFIETEAKRIEKPTANKSNSANNAYKKNKTGKNKPEIRKENYVYYPENMSRFLMADNKIIQSIADELYIDKYGYIKYKNDDSYWKTIYEEDKDMFGVINYWQTPLEYVFNRFRGDCEDRAVFLLNIFASGNMSVEDSNGIIKKQKIPAKLYVGFAGKSPDAWIKYEINNETFYTSIGKREVLYMWSQENNGFFMPQREYEYGKEWKLV